MVLTALRLGLGQLFAPAFRRVLGLGLALSAALLLGVYGLFLLMIDTFLPETLDLPFIGPVEGLQSLLGWASLGLILVLSIFLMLPVAAAFASLFLDDVADAVEARHYPGLPPARRLPLGEAMIGAVNLIGLMIALNVLAFLAIPFIGPAAPLLFWALNGWLLARDYFTMAAGRRLPRPQARALFRQNLGRAWALGTLLAVPLLVPVVNLFVPLLGAAAFTHLVQRQTRQAR